VLQRFLLCLKPEKKESKIFTSDQLFFNSLSQKDNSQPLPVPIGWSASEMGEWRIVSEPQELQPTGKMPRIKPYLVGLFRRPHARIAVPPNGDECATASPRPPIKPPDLLWAKRNGPAFGGLALDPELDVLRATIQIWDARIRHSRLYGNPVHHRQVLPEQSPQAVVLRHQRNLGSEMFLSRGFTQTNEWCAQQ
jgi:hypothetical protein